MKTIFSILIISVLVFFIFQKAKNQIEANSLLKEITILCEEARQTEGGTIK